LFMPVLLSLIALVFRFLEPALWEKKWKLHFRQSFILWWHIFVFLIHFKLFISFVKKQINKFKLVLAY
jgi:hypothetical protein